MPTPWTETVAGHRSSVRDAVLDAASALVAAQGLDLTMSQVAERAGIGRATLYRHFADVDAVLTAWHERQIGSHLQHLTAVRDRVADPVERVEQVLAAYAGMSRHGGQSAAAARLHRSEHVGRVRDQLRDFLAELLAEGARAGRLRGDVPPAELAEFVLGALTAAGELPSAAAVQRLVGVTVAGLRPPP
ncbi:TetR/AcrR family transcriptional regulator [Blastococcus sp. TBT05-19]|uniref:TetR/AcrR family transcriptional regulator n=1 Tax=Blastococcus sp. TBT05-19 TaxID=2250581 RepID=UPI000DE985A1|nr:TetR/AcrR family transcriptional regulator [Blastococcus sp. TBT05-19]RBY94668.1 TetR/AcrR family transcriptional regulator [Blastococcus sp. TBT05-19]